MMTGGGEEFKNAGILQLCAIIVLLVFPACGSGLLSGGWVSTPQSHASVSPCELTHVLVGSSDAAEVPTRPRRQQVRAAASADSASVPRFGWCLMASGAGCRKSSNLLTLETLFCTFTCAGAIAVVFWAQLRFICEVFFCFFRESAVLLTLDELCA